MSLKQELFPNTRLKLSLHALEPRFSRNLQESNQYDLIIAILNLFQTLSKFNYFTNFKIII